MLRLINRYIDLCILDQLGIFALLLSIDNSLKGKKKMNNLRPRVDRRLDWEVESMNVETTLSASKRGDDDGGCVG